MMKFKDFWGGDLINVSDVEIANSKQELAKIIERHQRFLETAANDAECHLNDFKIKLGLHII